MHAYATERTSETDFSHNVGALDQPRAGVGAVGAAVLRAEAVQRGERATWGDLEDRATAIGAVGAVGAVGPANVRRPVEVPIGGLDQRPVGVPAVCAATLGAKAVNRR
jgi:hypothetical protein